MFDNRTPMSSALDPVPRREGPLYVTLSARPPRLGVFLPLAANMPWQRSYEMALASQSRLWGGTANLIFPRTDDIAENELFWALAERLDADYCTSASFTRRDMSRLHPDWFAKEVAAIDRVMSDAPAEVRADTLEEILDLEAWAWDPDEDFSKLIERRLAPFHPGVGLGLIHHLVDDRRPLGEIEQHPLADVTQLRDWPEQVVNPQTDLGDVHQLLLTAEFGRLPQGFAEGIVVAEMATVAPYELSNGAAFSEALFRNRSDQVAFPWTLSELGLAWYRQGRWERDVVTLVTGETSWDFTLFLALRRWRTNAYWLPQSLADDGIYFPGLCGVLRRATRRTESSVQVVTASDVAFRDKVVADLAGVLHWGVPARAGDWRDVLPQRPLRLLDREGPGRAEAVAMHDGATVELATPVPSYARTRGSVLLRWVTDARVQGWAPIRHGALAMDVVDEPGFDGAHARTSRNGVAYTSTGWDTFSGTSLQMSAARPLLRPLGLIEQVDAALRADGWSCQASDKGAFAAESAALFGGFRHLARGLLDPSVRAVLEAFRDRNAPGKKAADRRYLTLADMGAILADERAAERVCGELDALGVLTRGLFLKCSKCRRAAWYDVAAVTTTFTCDRCRSEQRLTRAGWLGTVEPSWHYELAEVVRALLDHNGELPLLAVHGFFPPSERADDDIDLAFELDVLSPDGRKSEVDIAVRDGSKLWLGEATTSDHFEKAGPKESARLERLLDTTDILAPQGVLLASSTTFRPSTRTRAQRIFRGYWPALHIEQGVQTMPPALLQRQLQLKLNA